MCEYDAPITIFESTPFAETFLGLLGLFRQKGEVLLLNGLAEPRVDVCRHAGDILAGIYGLIYALAHTVSICSWKVQTCGR